MGYREKDNLRILCSAEKVRPLRAAVRSRLPNAPAHRAEVECLVLRSARARLRNTEPYARIRPRTALRDLRPSPKAELTTDQTTKKRPSEQP